MTKERNKSHYHFRNSSDYSTKSWSLKKIINGTDVFPLLSSFDKSYLGFCRACVEEFALFSSLLR